MIWCKSMKHPDYIPDIAPFLSNWIGWASCWVLGLPSEERQKQWQHLACVTNPLPGEPKNAKSLNRLVGGSICQTIYKLTRSCLNLVWHGSTLLASSCFIPSFAEGESKLDGKTIRHKCRLKVVFPNKQQRLIPLSPYHASAKVAARIANDAPKLWPVKTSFQ